MKRTTVCLLVMVLSSTVSTDSRSQAQDKSSQKVEEKAAWLAAAEKFALPLIEKKRLNAVVIGVIDRTGKKHYLALGEKPASLQQLDEHTIFEIGSITKTMTSMILADGIQRSELKLDDPVQGFLPQDITVPIRGTHVITLEDLATHTSGLPRIAGMQLGQFLVNPKLEQNPYASFDAEQLKKALASTKAVASKQPTIAYSNFGAGLLGYALCLKYGKSYEELLKERLFGPLGMKESSLVVPASDQTRFIDCYDQHGKACSHWDFTDVTAGAGGVRSSAADMLLYLEAASARTKTLRNAFELALAPQYEMPPMGKIGLAWIIGETPAKKRFYWHNGGTGGFSSFCAFAKDPAVAVVVLSNRSAPAGEIDKLGMRVFLELMK